MTIGELVKNERQKRKLTRHELSVLAGVNPSRITELEGNKYRPVREKIEPIARALDISDETLDKFKFYVKKNNKPANFAERFIHLETCPTCGKEKLYVNNPRTFAVCRSDKCRYAGRMQ